MQDDDLQCCSLVFNSGRFLWNYEIEKSFSPCTLLHNCFLFVWCVFFSPWGNLNFSSPFYLELLLFSLFICFEILIAFSFSTTFFLSALPHALLFCSCYSFFRHVWFIMHSSANVISTSIHLQINSHICKAHSVNPHTAGLCSSSSVYSAFFSNELWNEHYGNQFVANQCNVFQHQMMCFSVRQSEEVKWQCKLEK